LVNSPFDLSQTMTTIYYLWLFAANWTATSSLTDTNC
jgi:hypothetical protein